MSEPTPRDTAANEAARQAVMFAFAIGAAIALYPLQRKIARIHADALRGDFTEQDMREAERAADRWDRAAAYLFRVNLFPFARLAHERAEDARRRYEELRP